MRPESFSQSTTKALWTTPHIARQMLAAHLDPASDLASRRGTTIRDSVRWIDKVVNLQGKQVCDLGCGPGLYARGFASAGATVVGVDFSKTSVAYAQGLSASRQDGVRYVVADYLTDELPTGFDIVSLIFCDYCALSVDQRHDLLKRIRSMIARGGVFLFDVSTIAALALQRESTRIETNLMNGFFAADPYLGVHSTFVYTDEALSLDRYLILTQPACGPLQVRRFFNWHQYFTLSLLRSELETCGFEITHVREDLTGRAFREQSPTLAVVTRAC